MLRVCLGECDPVESIVQQLEMSLDWDGNENPFVTVLKEKASEGLDVRLFLNDDASYASSSAVDVEAALNGTGIKVQRCITNRFAFTTIHNKGVIIDNRSVLISSINWNEVSVCENREAAVLVENPTVAAYFTAVYLHDWTMSSSRAHAGGTPWGDFQEPHFNCRCRHRRCAVHRVLETT